MSLEVCILPSGEPRLEKVESLPPRRRVHTVMPSVSGRLCSLLLLSRTEASEKHDEHAEEK